MRSILLQLRSESKSQGNSPALYPEHSLTYFIYNFIAINKLLLFLNRCCEKRFLAPRPEYTLKEMTSQTDRYSVSLFSKTYVFEDKMTKDQSARPAISFCAGSSSSAFLQLYIFCFHLNLNDRLDSCPGRKAWAQ